ncbi:MAG: hypothetical protein HN757_08430, partial [Calditrichaeota bacterium]|nr:hypothetical protein [Calditrichota bacterium]
MLIKDTFFLLFMIAFSITVPFAIPAGASTEHSSNLHTEDRENNPVGMERDLNHPDIDVEPNAIEDEINSGESVERILNFSNLGDEAISFRIEYELINQPDRDLQNTRPTSFLRRINPQHDDPGDILFQLELNTINITGLDWDPDENVMWAASYDPEIIHAYTYNGAGEVENVFNQRLNERSKGVGYLRNIVYTIQYWTSFVFRFDRDGEALGELELDCDRVMDLATSQDEGWLLVFDGVNRDIHVYDVENDHQRIGVIDGGQVFGQMGGRWARSMCWVDDHPDGQLWLGSEDRVWQFYVDTENWHTDLVQDFETQAESALLAIGHDGNNIWRPTNRNDRLVQVYDDGITEVKWISIEPDEGDLEADSDIDVIVGLNATHLNGGEYELDLHFLSNDPDNPGVAVNVRLNVIGVPDLELEWSENRGFPEVIDWNRAFPDVYSGGPYEIPVSMTNEGTQVLNVEDVFSENEYFFFEFEQQFELQIGETIVGNFIFEGEEPGDYNTSMIIVSDDPDEERIEIDLHARALLPPIAILEPDAFNRDLFNDEEAQLEVVITNEGDNLLRWWSDFEIIGRREMDNLKSGRKVRSINGAERNPRRDQIEGRGLLLSEVCGWENWDFEQYFQAIDDLEYDRFHTWDEVGDIDFDDYDFMWIGNYETEGWVIDHNENLERIEEFVDNGGALYHSSGSNRHITRPVNPGGLVYTWGRINGDEVQDDCPLMLNPGDNFLINYMNENDDFDWEWREGQILAGAAHGVFNQRDINELENSNWSEILAMGNPVEEPIIVTYQFGNGYVLASTTVDGYLHARQEEFPWGRTGVGVIHYLDFLTNFSKWATWDPHRGELQPDED